tara:strand:+ start:371 stop:514 length:144 start_codon:yes stop_codon:yes gene_type:complete
MDTKNSFLFTIKEVSKFLGIFISTINRLVKEVDFPPEVNYTQKNKFL